MNAKVKVEQKYKEQIEKALESKKDLRFNMEDTEIPII